ncbi:transposase [Nonomuraea mangrovi]|uniref:Transposase n=1 Tax=Nonomuraea mangrovi TaxID=2316207 RepID=A0ABW4SK82_9ACTN
MGETRRRFDPHFRAGAARIVRETGKPIAQVAKDLGINAGTLANWVQMDQPAREQDTNGGQRDAPSCGRRVVSAWSSARLTSVPPGSATKSRSG